MLLPILPRASQSTTSRLLISLFFAHAGFHDIAGIVRRHLMGLLRKEKAYSNWSLSSGATQVPFLGQPSRYSNQLRMGDLRKMGERIQQVFLRSESYSDFDPPSDSGILHLRAAGHDIIILNSYEAAIELLERRSSIYSSRPQFTMITELYDSVSDLRCNSISHVLI